MRQLMVTIPLALLLFTACDQGVEVSPRNSSELTERAQSNRHAFVSSNSSGVLTIFGVADVHSGVESRGILVPYADAAGVAYDVSASTLYQVNRVDNQVMAIKDVLTYMDGESAGISGMSSADFSNGREATYFNNFLVVADDTEPGALYTYNLRGGSLQLFQQNTVSIDLWGIQADGKDLWAVVGRTNQLALFANFFRSGSGHLDTKAMVEIERLTSPHGLHYDRESDIMLITDAGEEADSTDGALIIITDFRDKWNIAAGGFGTQGSTGMIPLSEQIKIAGPLSRLGDPVDVTMNSESGEILVAERANELFLVFEMPADNGDAEPIFSAPVAGASAVSLGIQQVFTTRFK